MIMMLRITIIGRVRWMLIADLKESYEGYEAELLLPAYRCFRYLLTKGSVATPLRR